MLVGQEIGTDGKAERSATLRHVTAGDFARLANLVIDTEPVGFGYGYGISE